MISCKSVLALLFLTGCGSLLKRLLGSRSSHVDHVDHTDCYFDEECHAKVDWDKVKILKEYFLQQLKILKDKQKPGDVQRLIMSERKKYVSAEMPDDRIDYMLTKWVEFVYPESLEVNFKNSSIIVSGFTCDNGYGKDVNQKYEYQGTTKDGRPFYRGTDRRDRYMYYDSYCADDTREPRWLVGGKPEVTRGFGLNVNDGEGCENEFSIVSDSKHVPGGYQNVAWNWCGDHGLHESEFVSITYVLPRKDAPIEIKKATVVHLDKESLSPAAKTRLGRIWGRLGTLFV